MKKLNLKNYIEHLNTRINYQKRKIKKFIRINHITE